MKFQAGLKGIDLDEVAKKNGKEAKTVEDVKRRVQARRMGISEDDLHAQQIGIKVIRE